MKRILGVVLALALAAVLVPQGSAPAEAANKKAKNSSANQQGRVQTQDLHFTKILDKAASPGRASRLVKNRAARRRQ